MNPTRLSQPRARQPTDFGGEDEVAFRQAINLVRPEGELDAAPGQINIGMMVLLFGQFPDLVGKMERLAEILELIFPFQMMFVDDAPAFPQFPRQGGQVVSFEGRRAAFARHTIFLRQFVHNLKKIITRKLRRQSRS